MSEQPNRSKQPHAGQQGKQHEPEYAPSMEDDQLDEPATEEEIKKGDSTFVSHLYIDYID
ncbi:hypothetical protein [Brevibacillus massiliensis]|uniref:hypothetical protein n=1 Tax=Brevibacillus massiliensis TaxID=1118054 RepID=UPI0002EA38B5|nr:hypothetical protein [Brevibacillus massiliensis]